MVASVTVFQKLTKNALLIITANSRVAIIPNKKNNKNVAIHPLSLRNVANDDDSYNNCNHSNSTSVCLN